MRRRWLATLMTAFAVLMSMHASSAMSEGSGKPRVANIAAAEAALDHELAAIVNDPERPFASLSVLSIRGGRVVYHKQFGYKWIDNASPSDSKRADANTMYRIASISKLVTTLGALKLVEQGRLSLDKDIGDYLGYRVRNPHFPDVPITVRMLMTHTSSLRDDAGYYWQSKNALRDVLVPGGPLYGEGAMWAKNAKPGAYFQYANLPWGVLATVMERASGERFDRLMRRLILDPMNLRGGFHPADFSADDLKNTATLYRKRKEVDGKEIWEPEGPWLPQVDDYSKDAPVQRADASYEIGTNGTAFSPQGGLRISAADLGQIMLMLMNKGRHNGKLILKPSTVDLMLTTQWRHDGKGGNGSSGYGDHQDQFNAWALGTQIFVDKSGPARGDRLVEGGGFKAHGHFGDAWGLTSAFVFDRSKKNGMIFFVGGPGVNPESDKGAYSGFYRYEERILNALYKRAILRSAK